MLQYLLPLISRESEITGNAVRVVMNSGEVLICLNDELEDRLAETCPETLSQFKLDIHRFGKKTTVAHLLHLPTDTAFVGRSICENPERFSRKAGQQAAVRDAVMQFMSHERYRMKWPALELPNPL